MSDVILSSGVRSNLNSLQTTSTLLQSTQNKLATGKRVNSALDNPTNFFTAQSLNDRAGQLNSLQDGISNAVKTLEAADNGIKAITKLVESAQSTARQALQNASDNKTTITGSSTVDTTGVTGTGSVAEKVAGQDLGSIGLTTGDTLEISVDDNAGNVNTFTYTVGATPSDETIQDVVDAINNSGVASASITNDGKLSFSADGGSDVSLTINDADGDASSASAQNAGVYANLGFGTTADSTTPGPTSAGGVDVTFTDGATAGDADSLSISKQAVGTSTSSANAELKSQFNEILSQIDQLSDDASFNGVNLINSSSSSLKVAFNEKRDAGESSLTISGKDLTSTGLGISEAATLDEAEANAKLDSLSNALDSLRKAGSTFGSQLNTVKVREEFTNDLSNTLQTGADNLVIADTNEEGARLLALQTRQSLSTTSLSLASQADQNVLRLF